MAEHLRDSRPRPARGRQSPEDPRRGDPRWKGALGATVEASVRPPSDFLPSAAGPRSQEARGLAVYALPGFSHSGTGAPFVQPPSLILLTKRHMPRHMLAQSGSGNRWPDLSCWQIPPYDG